MSVGGAPSSGDTTTPRLVEAYEGLRRRHGWHGWHGWHGCEGRGGAGHEVLRRQGLAAWIQAFSGCVGAVAPEVPEAPEAPEAPERPEPAAPAHPSTRRATVEREAGGWGGWGVPARLYPELTRLVAGIALGRLEEGS